MSSSQASEPETGPYQNTNTDYFTRPFDTQHEVKDQDATPKPFTDAWRFTPSLMDPNSFAFSAFANQPPGYYTPTPGGYGTLYHPQAGDLHTPGMGMNTPLSIPHSIHGLHAHDALAQFQHFNPQFLHQPHPFQEHFPQPQPQHQMPQQQAQTFAPQQFLQHQDSGYVAMDDSPHKTAPTHVDVGIVPSSISQSIQSSVTGAIGLQTLPMGEKSVFDIEQNGHADSGGRFRFHTTLNAPTAMTRHSDEIPITYLNKGQAYTMSIFDTTPPVPQPNTVLKYRTYVRVSFEDKQQRARPGACWQLWKEGRGSNEAHQRGGRLLAVEYVDPNQGGDDELRKSQIQLEKASFDGFAVTWYPNSINAGPDCSISIRFNFLSTDFSHSKGVKGIPVRLCAKTELVTADPMSSAEPEVCFSKVKLFRDHGAERKLSNDVAHVKKTIEKLKQQIAQAEAGLGNAGKRRRSGSMARTSSSRPGKVVKHKRTWSVDSEGEGTKFSAEEDLQMKLVNMQDMFSSTQPVSVLFLRGDPEDDPDLHPVKLPGDDPEMKELVRTTTWESRQSVSDSPPSNMVSPSASSASQTTPKRKFSDMRKSTILEEQESDNDIAPTTSGAASRPIKVPKTEVESKSDLFALDVDSSYQPPSERPIRPIACFYVRQKDAAKEYYRAVYLMQRTVKDLVNSISQKFDIDPHRVTQVTHVNSRGLHIIVDEDVVRELPEGQDMIVELSPAAQHDQQLKQEFLQPAVTEVMVDGDILPSEIVISDPLEMWLNY
ncbi:uncharacterized protein A1O9_00545 [Exophiala aquamarina CBS 119918]|uniref:Grh/CP2 DB domain-containing protein n=1 Tax=Exophiala aquamarina CBS 119918 TaxID=1182545 RepID=A0A072PS23_9EURO|nr:uncharacterized protein A1O9_00545 [Exophiala aquamarina CBS 119918]KEF62572.1 hypothetical protein A1O9_00545 [Exophiala aquamarina CBS 119918]